MNNNNNKEKPNHLCDKEVKDMMKGIHRKCSDKKSYKKCIFMGGNEMNIWMLGRVGKQPFDPKKKYIVCANLQRLLLNVPVKQPLVLCNREEVELDSVEKTAKKTAKKNASDVIVLPSMTREERLQRRNRIPVNDPNLLGIKEVIVKVGEKEDGVIDLTKNRKSTSKKFIDDVLYKRFYRVPFGRLTMRQRRVRMRELSTNILSACIIN